MIAFATLWLGLVTGSLPVELLADATVARIELRLDGSSCGVLTAPPWAATCELGEELAPHELTATAYDATGRQTGETRQWLNVPRPPAELEVAVTTEAGPPPRLVARIAWAAPGGAAPTALRATLDGVGIAPSTDLRRLELPPLSRGGAQVLRVEADFPGGMRATRELAVGGDFAEQVTEELTGVPVEIAGRRDPVHALGLSPSQPQEAADGFRTLPLVALEKGEAQLVVVLDPSSRDVLDRLAREGNKQRVTRSGGGPGLGGRTITAEPRVTVPLPEGSRLRMVWPVAESRRQAELRYDLFPTSPERTADDGTLLDHLRVASELPVTSTASRLADAVAVAALTAAQPGSRRAVVLVLGEHPNDASLYAPARVRRFLDRLRVPLVVWSTAPPATEVTAAWGEASTIASLPRLERAARELDSLLARQRIAWVAGRYLPQQLQAAPGTGLRLATAEAPAVEEHREPAVDPTAEATPVERVKQGGRERAGAPIVASLPPGWQQRPLDPFTLATDVRDEHLLTAVAGAAAALPKDFERRFGLRAQPAGAVLVFAREEAFRTWLDERGGGDEGVEGFARGGVAALSAEGSRSEEVSALMVHELVHLLTRAACGRQLPPWIEEGLAEELAMSRRDAHGRTLVGTLRATRSARQMSPVPLPGRNVYEVSLAGPAAALVSLVRGPRPSLLELLAMPWERFVVEGGRPERYAASGFFVRFLLDGDRERWREGFRSFLAAVAAGGAADVAALESFLGTPVAALQAPFDGWLRRTAQTAR